jgi:hypothetical protein
MFFEFFFVLIVCNLCFLDNFNVLILKKIITLIYFELKNIF